MPRHLLGRLSSVGELRKDALALFATRCGRYRQSVVECSWCVIMYVGCVAMHALPRDFGFGYDFGSGICSDASAQSKAPILHLLFCTAQCFVLGIAKHIYTVCIIGASPNRISAPFLWNESRIMTRGVRRWI
jgi:hypothetical protein